VPPATLSEGGHDLPLPASHEGARIRHEARDHELPGAGCHRAGDLGDAIVRRTGDGETVGEKIGQVPAIRQGGVRGARNLVLVGIVLALERLDLFVKIRRHALALEREAKGVIGARGQGHLDGLDRFVAKARLDRIRARVNRRGTTPTIALAVPAILPPPFSLTPFVLSCGALHINPWRFFGIFAAMRLVRFGVEAVLATIYGRDILRVLESDGLQMVIAGFLVLAFIGTIVTLVMLWRNTREPKAQIA